MEPENGLRTRNFKHNLCSLQNRIVLFQVEDILRAKITDNWKAIASAYLGIDGDRDGSISRDELKHLLEKYCLPVSNDHFDL